MKCPFECFKCPFKDCAADDNGNLTREQVAAGKKLTWKTFPSWKDLLVPHKVGYPAGYVRVKE